MAADGPAVTQVVAAIIVDHRDQVLLAQRPAGKHLAGMWEFPGGKLEAGETAATALARELLEELGCHLIRSAPCFQQTHDYGDRLIALDFHWALVKWDGSPEDRGRENQPLAWTPIHALNQVEMPPADRPLIAHLQTATPPPSLVSQWRHTNPR